MKISQLIYKLQEIQSQHGDIDVLHDLDVGDNVVNVERVDYNSQEDAKSNGLQANAVILV